MNWTSSDTTGQYTGLGTGLSLARGSGNCFDFATAFLFDGMTDFAKVKEIMIFGVIIWQPVAPWGGTLIFTYSRLRSFFGGSKFEFQFFFGFQKNEYFRGMKILWIFLWVHHII